MYHQEVGNLKTMTVAGPPTPTTDWVHGLPSRLGPRTTLRTRSTDYTVDWVHRLALHTALTDHPKKIENN